MEGIYISALGVALVVVAALIAALLAWRLSKAFTARASYRAAIAFFVVFGAIVSMTWDVALTSLEMAELCPKGGMFVKRSVQVNSYYTNIGGPDELKEGLDFIEKKGVGNEIIIYFRDGSEIRTVEQPASSYQIKSRYEFLFDSASGPYDRRRDIGFLKSVVRDRVSGDELAYTIRYYAYPGWVDRNTTALLAKVLWICPDSVDSQEIEMRRRTLLPIEK